MGEGVETDAKERCHLSLGCCSRECARQNELGACYENGFGVEKDFKEAERLYRLAAEQGYSYGQWNLALCYMAGRGVQKDQKQAVRWHRLAAGQGHVRSRYTLISYYENGIGVMKDVNEARYLSRTTEAPNDLPNIAPRGSSMNQ